MGLTFKIAFLKWLVISKPPLNDDWDISRKVSVHHIRVAVDVRKSD